MITIKPKHIILLCLFLFPYLALSFFSFPSADDFAFTNLAKEKGIWDSIIHLYLSWTGRYSSALFMVLNPMLLNSLALYQICSILLISLLLLSYLKLGHFFARFYKFHGNAGLIIGTVFFVSFIAHIRSQSQGLYWYTGYVVYILPLTFVNLLIPQIHKLHRNLKLIDFLLVSLLIVFLVAFNELLLLYINSGLLLLFLYFKKTKKFLIYTSLFIISIISSLIVIAAPGNRIRAAKFERLEPFWLDMIQWPLVTLEHLVNFISFPTFFHMAFFYFLGKQSKQAKIYKLSFKLSLRNSFSLLFLIVFIGMLPGFIAIGGQPPSRADNLIFYFYLIGLTFISYELGLADSIKIYRFFNRIKISNLSQVFTILLLSSVFLSKTIFAYISLIDAPKYLKELKQRALIAKDFAVNSPSEPVYFKPLSVYPQSIHFSEMSPNKQDWKNIAYSTYYGIASVEIKK